MDWYRLWHTIRMCTIPNAFKRAEYIRKHHIFRHMGSDCMVMFRKIPLYPELISFQDNVRVASNVTFITHDVTYTMLNHKFHTNRFKEFKDCIDVRENVFIGANSTILPGVRIGPNVILAAGTLVNRDIEEGVFAGTPARFMCEISEFVRKRDVLEQYKKEILDKEINEEYWELFEAKRDRERS